MRFYFSGIGSPDETAMLREAGVRRVLVDPVDLPNVQDWPDEDVALDCGAYRRFKKRNAPTVEEFESYCVLANSRSFAFVVQYEAIGATAMRNYLWWRAMLERGIRAVPVWQWGTQAEWLRLLLDEAPLVGIGGAVNLLRSKEPLVSDRDRYPRELDREDLVEGVLRVAARYPDRLHLFGGCWLSALERLNGALHSSDSSKWLDGRRYRLSIFRNTRTGHLSQAPSRALGIGDQDGRRLSIDNARNIQDYLECAPPA
jgi:hypothetical protein